MSERKGAREGGEWLTKQDLWLEEAAIPLRDEISGTIELMGLDPLYLANEGKVLLVAVMATFNCSGKYIIYNLWITDISACDSMPFYTYQTPMPLRGTTDELLT